MTTVTSKVVSSLFILASSVCKSLQYLTSALTQGGEGNHLLRPSCSVVLRGGRNTANKYHWRVWRVLPVSGHTGFGPSVIVCAFWVYPTPVQGSSARELPKAGPALHALPKSKPLGFRFLESPQKHRLSWACVLCPSQVQAAQMTR